MDNKVLDDIKNYAIQRLNQAYGYCGSAEAPAMAMLSSGGDGENITIHIKCDKDSSVRSHGGNDLVRVGNSTII